MLNEVSLFLHSLVHGEMLSHGSVTFSGSGVNLVKQYSDLSFLEHKNWRARKKR